MKLIYLLVLAVLLLFQCALSQEEEIYYYDIPVVVVKYFPLTPDSADLAKRKIDITVTGDWGKSFLFTRRRVDSLCYRLVEVLEEGSRFRAYKNPGVQPSLKYRILKDFEVLEPLPTYRKKGHKTPMTDYNAIMNRIKGKYWVEKRGVKEFWLWAYHGGKVDLWESNMAGPYGDISNSDRDHDDLPVYEHTYTVYHYNYQRGLSEAVENHMHQIEAVLNFVDGRDEADKDEWDELLFWGKFVGSDKSHQIINPGCGWAHYPPNGEKDYDWANKRYVLTDIEDWKPDGTGRNKKMNCDRWNCNGLDWFIFWMQSLPGRDNGLTYKGKGLSNWWIFIGSWDMAMRNKLTLVNE